MKEFLNHWGLSLAIFLPVAGAIVMLVIPRKEESAHKWIALLTSGAVFVMGILLLTNFDYDRSGELQYVVDKQWIPLINSRYIVGPRRHLAPAVDAHGARRPAVHHLLVEPLARTGQLQGVLHPAAHPRDGHGRHLRGAGPDPVLRVLRDRPPADVLHDRRLGRRAAPVRGDQVLPLHAVRVGADDRQLHRAVPAVGQGPGRRPVGQHLRHARAALRGSRHLVDCRALDLRRHVHRLRHQGADLPVPHLAARTRTPRRPRWARSSWPPCS